MERNFEDESFALLGRFFSTDREHGSGALFSSTGIKPIFAWFAREITIDCIVVEWHAKQ